MATDPGTRSPGKLALVYTTAGRQHEASVRFLTGVDINDITTIRTNATTLAGLVKAVLPVASQITAWRIKDPNGLRLYEEAFSPVIAGTHSASGNAWVSTTITITGKGVPIDLAHAAGQCRFPIYTSNAYAFGAGTRFINSNFDASLQALVDHMHSNLRYFADFFGQHAEPRSTVTVQFNAYTQRKYGT